MNLDNVIASASPEEKFFQGFSNQRLELIGPTIESYIATHKIAGAVTAIARNGHVVHLQAHGLASVESMSPMQTNTLFRIYSMTKPITAVAIMMLYEQGLFLLDDPVANYLPEFSAMSVLTDKGFENKMIVKK